MPRPADDEFDDRALYSPRAVAPTSNPLASYFRIPGLHVQIPTRGAFLPPGAISFTDAHDLPVMPMRAQDELLLKSPDALMSGFAIESLLKSCVPAIRNARLISTPDLDVLLLAIRAATYGEKMTLSVNCPACEAENTFDCNLPAMLHGMRFIEPEPHVRLSDELVAYVRPYNVANATEMALATYEEAQKLRALEAPEIGRNERVAAMNASMDRLTKLKFVLMADCVTKVVVPGSEVTETRYIADFVNNIAKPWMETIEAKIDEVNSGGMDKSLEVTCAACQHQWKTEVEFNPSNFFAGASSN